MNNSHLIVIGASGHGKVVAEIAELTNKYEQIYFMDDYSEDKMFHGYQNLGPTTGLDKYKNSTDVFVAIGDNRIRAEKLQDFENNGFSIATLVHPNAVISPSTSIGRGTVVMAGVIINASTEIGFGNIINTNVSVDHDCKLGDFVHISPGTTIAGSVSIGSNTWIGAGSVIINNIYISEHTLVGAGGVVVQDIVQSGTYIGVPVKRKK
ncbi:acetyltransferase [Aerococcus urinaeequi]